MFEVKNLHSPKKISSMNSNCIAPKPKIFMFKKINNLRLEKARENTIKFLSKKALRFVVEKNEDYNKKKLNENDAMNEGRWAEEEHDKFLDGIAKYGINWKKVKTMINSRTPVQVRSHAQKFYYKLKMCKDEQLGIDFTKDDISSIRDMIHQIKEINSNYSIKYILKYLSQNCDEMKKSKKFGSRNCTGRPRCSAPPPGRIRRRRRERRGGAEQDKEAPRQRSGWFSFCQSDNSCSYRFKQDSDERAAASASFPMADLSSSRESKRVSGLRNSQSQTAASAP